MLAQGAFRGCSSLTSITLPKSFEEFVNIAFCNCSLLSEVIYEGTVNDWQNVIIGLNAFLNTRVTTIKCSDGTVPLE